MAGGGGHAGAAVLATRSALRSGAGLVTAHVPGGCVSIVQIGAPEAMCSADPSENALTTLPKLDGYSAIGIGPGLGVNGDTALVVKRIIQDTSGPLVIDADALNIIAENATWMAFLSPATILTPHPKEFDRLVGRSVASGFERVEMAREMALKNRCVVVLKGAWTAICDPTGQVFFNPTGNPGMAKGGSGDVLTGLLTGLLAQGYAPLRAAVLGVYLHGLAGDIAARDIGMDAMTAGDLIAALPKAWQELRGASEQAVQ
ncbi:MAG: NAD(P)H-hydrate dehydratase [Flavobacteriales bacterium]